MKMRFGAYTWSLAISLVLIVLVGTIASIPGCSVGWDLLLPGALLAAIVFPQGVNSSGGNLYLVLAAILDIVLLSFPVMWAWRLFERRKAQKSADH
jgi:uncharacterized membrane protein